MIDSINHIANAVADARERGSTLEDAQKIFQQKLFRDYKLRVALSDLFVVRMWNGDGVGLPYHAEHGRGIFANPSPHQSGDRDSFGDAVSNGLVEDVASSDPFSEAGSTSVAVNGISTCAAASETASPEHAASAAPQKGICDSACSGDTKGAGGAGVMLPSVIEMVAPTSAPTPESLVRVKQHVRLRPAHAKRMGATMASARKVLTDRYLETLVIDGVVLGEWTVGNAAKVGARKTFEGRVLMTCVAEVRSRYANVKDNQTFAEVLRSEDVERIVADARQAIAA